MISGVLLETETVGFEPTCRLPDNRISSAARYNHFDTSPEHSVLPAICARRNPNFYIIHDKSFFV